MMQALWKWTYENNLCPWWHKWTTGSNLTWNILCSKPPLIRAKEWSLIFKPVWVRLSATCKRKKKKKKKKHWNRYEKNLYWPLTLIISLPKLFELWEEGVFLLREFTLYLTGYLMALLVLGHFKLRVIDWGLLAVRGEVGWKSTQEQREIMVHIYSEVDLGVWVESENISL